MQGYAAAGQPPGRRRGAGADDDQVGGEHLAGLQLDAGGTAVLRGDACDAGSQPEVGAGGPVQVGADQAGLGADGPREGHVERLEHGDREAPGPGRRGDFGADEPGADHDGPGSGVEGRTDCPGVLDGAERVDAGDALGARQRAGVRARGDDEGVVPDLLVADHHGVVGRMQGGRGRAQAEVDAEVHAQRLRGAQHGRPGRTVRGEHGLGQRGPVVGRVRLGPDQHDLAVEAAPAGGLDGTHSGQ